MARTFRLDLPGDADAAAMSAGSVFFVGTATTVIRYGGFTILTDPNFLHAGDHAHLGYGLTSKRLTNPAVEVEDLPPLDACVLSHLHGDHWDRVAEAKLPHTLSVITTPHAARALRRQGFAAAHGLASWDALTLHKGRAWLRVTSMPGKHAFGVVGAILPPVMGSMLEWGVGDATAFRLYISGDTLLHEDLARIPERFPDIHLGLFHLGGTRVLGLLVTMDAAQGVQAVRTIAPRVAIPIHYDDYPVFKSPLADFQRAVATASLRTQVRYLRRGETYEFEVGAGARLAKGEGASREARSP
jgi:L-ascorbate metabolism protein UlaG (beta-lactamase superfamily)